MISELNRVPLGWEKVKFGDIAKNVTDRIDDPKTSGLKDYIGLEHLETDEIRIKRYGSPDEVEATKFLCKKGDIIFGKRRAYLRKIAVTSRDAVVSAHSMVLRPRAEKILPEFLPWFMYSSQFWKTAFAVSEGSLSPTIKWKTLSAQEFWLPSQNEQRKIAEILWSIESNVEELEHLIQVAEKFKKGLLKELLKKGIGHKKFKKTDLGEIPEDWKIFQIEQLLIETKYGISVKLNNEGRYPVIKMDNLSNDLVNFRNGKYVDLNEEVARSYKLQIGDILFNRTNSFEHVGRTATFKLQGEYLFASYLIMLRPNPNILVPDYLTFFLNSFNSEIKQLATLAVQQANINCTNLKRFRLPIPPLIEQTKICSIINSQKDQLDILKNHQLALRNLKKKLTNAFLSGELFVPLEVMN